MTLCDLITAENPLRLGSRASSLAMVQANEVKRKLEPLNVVIQTFSTKGDEVTDRPLAAIGGKGLFIKTIESAILDGRADAGVHSAKDMESHITEGTVIASYLEREDRRDALISTYPSLEHLPDGARVGTASVRRKAVLLMRRPDLKIDLLRGNIDTRIGQFREGKYDAIILAMAGLIRLGITDDVHPIDEAVMLPAAAQGAIAIQAPAIVQESKGAKVARHDAILTALNALNHEQTALEVNAERAVLARVQGSCTTAIGASAHLLDERLHLTTAIYSPDGASHCMKTGEAAAADSQALAESLADELLKDAGDTITLE